MGVRTKFGPNPAPDQLKRMQKVFEGIQVACDSRPARGEWSPRRRVGRYRYIPAPSVYAWYWGNHAST